MKNRKLSILLILLIFSLSIYGQTIKSEKGYLKIEKKEVSFPSSESNKTPEIIILSPSLNSQSEYTTSKSDLLIYGAISGMDQLESVVINSQFIEPNEKGKFTQHLELFPGNNTVIIGAIDSNNEFIEKRFNIKYIPIEVSLAEKVSQESKYFGLIIGINRYIDPALNSLQNPVPDAVKLYEVLTERYTFEEDNIQFIENAKREDIILALEHLSRVVSSNDNLLIFYAGHGNFDADANIGYWLPSNARKISSANWFGNSQLVDYIKQIGSKHTLLITDACFSGSIFTTRAAFADAPLAIEKLYELPSRKAMTSGRLSEVPDKSQFAKFLLERLRKNKDQYYAASDLFYSLRTAVLNNSEADPQYGEIKNVGDQGGDFIFIRK
ncbi:MAG: hypothetical protein GY790_06125 [Bacteroidetes bacterium]|nr:hypothetical protein [Bacteroidota bacterium]